MEILARPLQVRADDAAPRPPVNRDGRYLSIGF